MSTRSPQVVVGIAGALAVALLPAAPAVADGGHHGRGMVLNAPLVGSMPLTSPDATPIIAGKRPGGLGWATDPGSRVRVREDGRTDVRVKGLVFTEGPNVGRNTVLSVVATLVCGDEVADVTEPFALDTAGDGRTRDTLAVPDDCQDPAVLIQPNNAADQDPPSGPAYIAYTPGHHG